MGSNQKCFINSYDVDLINESNSLIESYINGDFLKTKFYDTMQQIKKEYRVYNII